jgi:hypothetical protein
MIKKTLRRRSSDPPAARGLQPRAPIVGFVIRKKQKIKSTRLKGFDFLNLLSHTYGMAMVLFGYFTTEL